MFVFLFDHVGYGFAVHVWHISPFDNVELQQALADNQQLLETLQKHITSVVVPVLTGCSMLIFLVLASTSHSMFCLT